MKRPQARKPVGMPPAHRALVRALTRDLKPVHRAPRAVVQWLIWLALSSAVSVAALLYLRPQDGLGKILSEIPKSMFLTAVYAASGLAAWGAIASSLPDREPGKGMKTVMAALLLLLVLVPVIFFPMPSGNPEFWTALWGCCNCIYVGTAVGIIPWLGLGFMLSRNASFHPGWTGAWAGVSAFLLGTGTVQLHCPSWEMHHVMLGHLLPVGLMTLPAAWFGGWWFARWKR